MDITRWNMLIAIMLALVICDVVPQDVYFDPAPRDQDVIEGEEVLLRCDVSNRKMIVFKWEMDDRKVNNDSRRFQDESDLRIRRVDRQLDNGIFTCIAFNASSSIALRSRGAQLNIQWMSDTAEIELNKPKEEEEIVMGGELQLRCHSEGAPEPTVTWFRNGDRIQASEDDNARLHRHRLRISNLTPSDNGVYSCQAGNDAGLARSSWDNNFLLRVAGEEAALLNMESFTKEVLVKRGDPALFNCQYDNAIATEWYNRDRLLSNDTDDGKFIVYDNGSLVINDVRSRDIGGYGCVGISQDGPVQTYMSQLTLAYLSSLTSASFSPRAPSDAPVVIPRYGEYRVTCQPPEGLPKPTLRWENTRGEIVAVDEGHIHTKGNTLFVTDLTPNDSGNYTCVVSNMADTQRRAVWVMVSEPPELTKIPISQRVDEGETMTFSCTFDGTPYPVTLVTWVKENQPLDKQNPRYGINVAEGVLTISNVQQSDEANYACVLNTQGHERVQSVNAKLYVTKILKFKPEPMDTKLELGAAARIYCKADGEDPPTILWQRDGDLELGRGVSNNDGVLEFAAVTASDAGAYTCEATSNQGTIRKTIQVDIVVMPWFKVLPKNTTGYEGHPTMLHCVAEGDPQPSIQWDKNGERYSIEDNDRFTTLANGSLSISVTYMEDIGKYGCTAGSGAGFSRAELYLMVSQQSPEAAKEYERFDMMRTVIIATCAAVAYLAVVIGLTVYCSLRLVKKRAARTKRSTTENNVHIGNGKIENGHGPTERTELMEQHSDVCAIKPIMSDDQRSHASAVSSHNSSHPSSSMRSASTYHKYNFPRTNILTMALNGKGQYGDVFLAKARYIISSEPETTVVIKSLMSTDERDHYEFRRDMDMFSRANHEHVVTLLGVCREQEPQFLLLEYPAWGDLKQFLCAMRRDNCHNLKVPPINQAQKITMCNQVAMGMEHLANLRLVHKDLASRNVLLQPNLDVKISNLGLCRDIFATEYYPLHHNYLVPLRWMAPETLYVPEEFTTKSDVWAFACFMYEVFSLGEVPYRHRTDEEVLTGLKTGDCVLDEIPVGCPPEIWDLVQKCLADSTSDRPSFSELCVALAEMTVDSDV